MIDKPPIGTILGAAYNSAHFDHIHVEPPSRKAGTPPRNNPGPTPGLAIIRRALDAVFPGWPTGYGYYNRRYIAGTDRWSQHAWANAQDIGPLYGIEEQRPIYDFLTKGILPVPTYRTVRNVPTWGQKVVDRGIAAGAIIVDDNQPDDFTQELTDGRLWAFLDRLGWPKGTGGP